MKKLLQLSKKDIGDTDGQAFLYGNISIDYQSLGDYQKAIKYSEKLSQLLRTLEMYQLRLTVIETLAEYTAI